MQMETSLPLRRARAEELEAVLQLYRSVLGRPFCSWNEEYPNELNIEEDHAGGGLYVWEEQGRLLAAISVVTENELDHLPFWQQREGARELARLAVRPEEQGKGYSGRIMLCLEDILRREGCRAVHLLATLDNIPALHCYPGIGYREMGECEEYGIRMKGFEKRL